MEIAARCPYFVRFSTTQSPMVRSSHAGSKEAGFCVTARRARGVYVRLRQNSIRVLRQNSRGVRVLRQNIDLQCLSVRILF
jgi:hypothetical protein